MENHWKNPHHKAFRLLDILLLNAVPPEGSYTVWLFAEVDHSFFTSRMITTNYAEIADTYMAAYNESKDAKALIHTLQNNIKELEEKKNEQKWAQIQGVGKNR